MNVSKATRSLSSTKDNQSLESLDTSDAVINHFLRSMKQFTDKNIINAFKLHQKISTPAHATFATIASIAVVRILLAFYCNKINCSKLRTIMESLL